MIPGIQDDLGQTLRRFRPWWNRGKPPQESSSQPETFDAIISVGGYNLPPGIVPGQAVAAIRQAVRALPGAVWIVVEHHPVGSGEGAVQVFPAGSGEPASADLSRRVEQAMAGAVGELARGLPAPPPRREPGILAPGVLTPGVLTHDEFVFPDAAAGTKPGFFDSQTFISISLPDVAARGTPSSVADHMIAGAGELQLSTDAELLAQLLAYVGIPGTAELANRVIARFGSFAAALGTSEIELRKIPGLGTHSIAAIKLVHATALRLSQAAIMNMPLLDRPDLLMHYLSAVLGRESIEHFRILFLDANGRLRADEAQARGTVNHTPVYPREVIGRALQLNAAAIILVHNHPSGDPSPSQDDIDMTATIVELGTVLKIRVQDHIIVGNGRWFSFRKEGLLDPEPD